MIAECDQEKSVDIAIAEIDLEKLENVRANMPCCKFLTQIFDKIKLLKFFHFPVNHRRDDIYQITVSPKLNISSSTFYFGPHNVPKETVFYESALSFAFTNIRCVVPGHVLVATKQPKKLLTDLSHEEARDFFETVSKVERVGCHVHSTQSTTVNVQNGEFSGQTVPHVHCHIMPRRKGDFEFNDMIYIQLARHDQPEFTENTERRPLEEMIAEADVWRKAFRDVFSDGQ